MIGPFRVTGQLMDLNRPTAYAAGDDTSSTGQLGVTGKRLCRTPQPILNILEPIESISAGGLHSVFLTKKGVYTCGCNDQYATGRDNVLQEKNEDEEDFIDRKFEFDSTPTLVFPSEKGAKITHIAAADGVTCYVVNKQLFLVGAFRDDSGNVQFNTQVEIQRTPYPIKIGANEEPVADVKCGDNHVVVLTEDNKVYAFGDHTFYQTGYRTSTRVPTGRWCTTDFPLISDIRLIAAGGSHSYFVKTNNDIYCCGLNGYGQLGRDANDPSIQGLQKNASLTKDFKKLGTILQIECANDNTLFLVQTAKGNKVFGIGKTKDGFLSKKGYTQSEYCCISPIEIPFPKKVEICSISCGENVAAAVSTAGDVYSWVFYINLGLNYKSCDRSRDRNR